MADNKTGLNAQYSEPLFGVGGTWDSTNAPGSQGAVDSPAGVGGGAVIAEPVISTPYASSQVAANMPTIPVVQGETSGFSDDIPVHQSPLLPAAPDAYLSTGAGRGSADHFKHYAAGGGAA